MTVKSEHTHGQGIRLTALAVAFVFTVTSVTWTTSAVASSVNATSAGVFPIDSLTIPAEMGTITSQFRVGSQELGEKENLQAPNSELRTVILIQDAHAVTDAQENIAKILGHLQKNYGVSLTALEGAKGRLEPVLLRAFPDPGVKRKILAGYEKRAELSGPEVAAVLQEKTSDYRGMEDWGLYEKNYFAYLHAQEKKSSLLAQWNAFKRTLDDERAKTYDPKLNEFEEIRENFLAERISLLDLLFYISKFKDLLKANSGYQELPGLIESIGYEKSGKSGALAPLVRKIADEFKAKYLRGLGVKTEMNFYNRYQAFMTGQITPGQMLQYLVHLGNECGKAVKLSPALKRMLGHAEVLSEIKGSQLGDELQRFLSQVEASLIKTPVERELAEKYRKLFLLKEMISLELAHEDFGEYQKEPDAYLDLIGAPAFKQDLAFSLEFYQAALERDQAFFKNIMSMMEKETSRTPNSGPRTVSVVAGGFHTQGLERLLKEKGVAYAVVAPKIASLSGSENYAKVMKGDVSFKDGLKTTYFDALMRHAAKALVEAMPIRDRVMTLKVWRDNVIREFAAQGRISEVGKYLPYIDEILQGMPEVVTAIDPKRTKEEILDVIQKGLEKFKKDSFERIWKTFEFQLDIFTDGLKQLIAGKDLNTQTVSALLDRASQSQPSFVALIQSLDPTIRVMRPPALPDMESPTSVTARPPALPVVAPSASVAEVSSPTQRSGESAVMPSAAGRSEMRLGAKVRAFIAMGMLVFSMFFVSIDAANSPAMAAGMKGATKAERMASLPKDVRAFLLKGFDRGAILEKAERREAQIDRVGKEATMKKASDDLKRIIDTVYTELPENERKAMHNLAMYIMQIESGFENMVQRKKSGKKLEPVLVGVGLGQVELTTVKETLSLYLKYDFKEDHFLNKIHEAEKAFVDQCLRDSVNITLAQLIKSFQTADPEMLRLALARLMLDNDFSLIMVLIKMDRLRIDLESGARVAAGGEKSFSDFHDSPHNYYKLYRGSKHETEVRRLLLAERDVAAHKLPVVSESGPGEEGEAPAEIATRSPAESRDDSVQPKYSEAVKEVPSKGKSRVTETVAEKMPSQEAASLAKVEAPASSSKSGYLGLGWFLVLPLMGVAITLLIERFFSNKRSSSAIRGYRDLSHQRAVRQPKVSVIKQAQPKEEAVRIVKAEKPVSYIRIGRAVLRGTWSVVRFLGGGVVMLGHRLYLAVRYSAKSPRDIRNQRVMRRKDKKDQGRRSEVRDSLGAETAANRSEMRQEEVPPTQEIGDEYKWGTQSAGKNKLIDVLKTRPVSELSKVLFSMGDVDKMGALNLVLGKYIVGVLGEAKSLDLLFPAQGSPFLEFHKDLKEIVEANGLEIHQGVGGDEFTLFAGERFNPRSLENVKDMITKAFLDRYFVVRINRPLSPEEVDDLKKQNHILAAMNFGRGVNILVDRSKLGGQDEWDFMGYLGWRFNLEEREYGMVKFETAGRGFFSVSIGGVMADNALEYLIAMMSKKLGKDGGRSYWIEKRKVLDPQGVLQEKEFIRRDRLELFWVWGMRLANDALSSAKETGRNRSVVLPSLVSARNQSSFVKNPMTAEKIEEEFRQIKERRDSPEVGSVGDTDRITGLLSEAAGRAMLAAWLDEMSEGNGIEVVEELTAASYGEDVVGRRPKTRPFHRLQDLIGYEGGDRVIKSLGNLAREIFGINPAMSVKGVLQKGIIPFREAPDKIWMAYAKRAQATRGPPITTKELDAFALELGKTVEGLGASYQTPPMLMITRIKNEELKRLNGSAKLPLNSLLSAQDVMSLMDWEWLRDAIKTVKIKEKTELDEIVDVEWGEHSVILTFDHAKAGKLLERYREAQERTGLATLKEELNGRFVTYAEHLAVRSEMRQLEGLRPELQEIMDQILGNAAATVFSETGARRNAAYRRFVEDLARDQGIELLEGALSLLDFNRDQFRNYFLAPGAVLREIREKQYRPLLQTLGYVALLPITHLMGQFMPPFTLRPRFDRAGEMKTILYSSRGKVYLSAIPTFTLFFWSLGTLTGSVLPPLLELVKTSVFFYAIEWILSLLRSRGHELSHVLQAVLIAVANQGTGRQVTDAEVDSYYSQGRSQQFVDGQGIGNAAPNDEQFEKIVRDVFQAMEEMLQKKELPGTRLETPAARSEVRGAQPITNSLGESFDEVYERENMAADGRLEDPRKWSIYKKDAAQAKKLSKMSLAELGKELRSLLSYQIIEIDSAMIPINDPDLFDLPDESFVQGFVDHWSGHMSHYVGYAKPAGQVLTTLRSLNSWGKTKAKLNNFALALREVAIRWSSVAFDPRLGSVEDVKQLGLNSDQIGPLAEKLYELSALCYSQKEQKGMSVGEWQDILKDPYQSVYILRDLSGAIVAAAVGGRSFTFEGKNGIWLDRLMSVDDKVLGKGTFLLDVFLSQMLKQDIKIFRWDVSRFSEDFYLNEEKGYLKPRQDAGMLRRLKHDPSRSVTPEADIEIELLADPLDKRFDDLRNFVGSRRSEVRFEVPEGVSSIAPDIGVGRVVDARDVLAAERSQLKPLAKKLYELELSSFPWEKKAGRLREWEETLRDPLQHVQLLVSGKNVVGATLSISPLPQGGGARLVEIMSVEDGAYGKGTYLMDVFLDEVYKKGIRDIEWYALGEGKDFYARFLKARRSKGILKFTQDGNSYNVRLLKDPLAPEFDGFRKFVGTRRSEVRFEVPEGIIPIAEHPLLGRVFDAEDWLERDPEQLVSLAEVLYRLEIASFPSRQGEAEVYLWERVLEDPEKTVCLLVNDSQEVVGTFVGSSFPSNDYHVAFLEEIMSLEDGIRGKGVFLMDVFFALSADREMKRFRIESMNGEEKKFYDAYFTARQIKSSPNAGGVYVGDVPERPWLSVTKKVRSEVRFEIPANVPVIAEHPLLGKVVRTLDWLKADPDQLQFLAEMLYELELSSYSDQRTETGVRKWEEMLQDPRQYIYVLLSPAGDLVGAARGHRPPEGVVGLGVRLYRIMSLKDGIRGRGTLLMDAFMDAAYARGVTAMDLYLLYGSEFFWASYFKPRQEKGMLTYESDDHSYNFRLLDRPLDPKFGDLRSFLGTQRSETRFEISESVPVIAKDGRLGTVVNAGDWLARDPGQLKRLAKMLYNLELSRGLAKREERMEDAIAEWEEQLEESPSDVYVLIRPAGDIGGLVRAHDVVMDSEKGVKMDRLVSAQRGAVGTGTFLMDAFLSALWKNGVKRIEWNSTYDAGPLFYKRFLERRQELKILTFVPGKLSYVVHLLQDPRGEPFRGFPALGGERRSEMRDKTPENPYVVEGNISRGLNVLDEAYGLSEELKTRQGPQQMLLIGVGRGFAAIELALKFPNVKIVAVNKELGLWNDQVIEAGMLKKGYALDEVRAARKRIELKEGLDIENEKTRAEQLGEQVFDLVVFETMTQIYLRDKVKVIQDLFNQRLKVGGVYAISLSRIFASRYPLSDGALEWDDEDQREEGGTVPIIWGAFGRSGKMAHVDFDEGRRNLTYKKTGNVNIPLMFVTAREEDLGGMFAWESFYRQAPRSEPDARSEMRFEIPAGVSVRASHPLLGKVVDAENLLMADPSLLTPLAEALYDLELARFKWDRTEEGAREWEQKLMDPRQYVELLFSPDGELTGATRSYFRPPEGYGVRLDRIMSAKDGIRGRGTLLLHAFFDAVLEGGETEVEFYSNHNQSMEFYDRSLQSLQKKGNLTFTSDDTLYNVTLSQSPLLQKFDSLRWYLGAPRFVKSENQETLLMQRSEARSSIKDIVENLLPPEYHEILTIDNLPPEAHKEGPQHGDHLQAMLNVLNQPAAHPEIPARYATILNDSDNRRFFEEFIVNHDLGKSRVEIAEIIEEGNRFRLYPKHEAKSVELMIQDSRLARGLSNREVLIQTIQLHGALNMIPNAAFGVPSAQDFQKFVDLIDPKVNTTEVLPLLIAADFLDTLATKRKDPWMVRVQNVAKAFEAWEAGRSEVLDADQAVLLTSSTVQAAPVAFLNDPEFMGFVGKMLQKRYSEWGISEDLVQRILNALRQHADDPEEARRQVYKFMDFKKDFGWDAAYARYKSAVKYNDSERQLAPFLKDLPQDFRLVDVGCGGNDLGKAIVDGYPRADVTGVDIMEYGGPKDSLSERLHYLKQPDPTHLPKEIPDGSVNVVTMNAALHHVSSENIPLLMKEIGRILKPGGRLILIEDTYSLNAPAEKGSDAEITEEFLELVRRKGPHFANSYFAFNDWYANILVHKWDGMSMVYNFHSAEEWAALLKSYGFEPAGMRHMGFAPSGFHKPDVGVLAFRWSSARSEMRTDQDPLKVVAGPDISYLAQMASNPDAVRGWFLKQGWSELGKKIESKVERLREELGRYSTAQELISFIRSPGFQERVTALLGEFGDVAELVFLIRNRVVFGDEPLSIERLADNASQLDLGKIASAQALLDTAAAGLLMNAKEPSFVLLMDRPGDGIAEEVLAMLATLKPSQLIVYNAAKEKPFGRAWQNKLKIPIMPIGNEGSVRRAVKASSDLVVSFWTQDRGMGDLGIYSVLAEIGRIADPRLRALALTAVRVAILRFATLDKETQSKILAEPSTIRSYLEQFGIPAFIQFNAKGLVFNIERLVEAYTARQAVEKAA